MSQIIYKASFQKQTFHFKQPSGTSRGVLTEKHAWFISLSELNTDNSEPVEESLGECSIIPGLSPDFVDFDSYEKKLKEVCKNITNYIENLSELEPYPSILFGLETALLGLNSKRENLLFDTPFSRGEIGIPINGLIWMGSKEFMLQQIEEKLQAGFYCLKLKIGALDFETELEIIASIRKRFAASDIELRVDANGAFSPSEVLIKLERLSKFQLHSIEQPIKAGQWEEMAKICRVTPLPIALDEELIGIVGKANKIDLLQKIQPQYIILKPSLHGGILGTKEWIKLAMEYNIPWWMTSALESNVGLNCVAQFASSFENSLPQGLGTGGLYENNTPSKLFIDKGYIFLGN
jgi:L-alanine-DL-glutamate epimerase-like enolase superfamily enzyme